MYEKAENLFEMEKDLVIEVMYIKFNYSHSKYMRVLRVAKVKSK